MAYSFPSNELLDLRAALQHRVDTRHAAEMLRMFLMGRGFGVSPQAALDAACRVGCSGCAMEIIQQELEGLALVM